MRRQIGEGDLAIQTSVGKHLALAPVAFAVTEGPAHTLLYANTMFRRLQSTGEIRIGTQTARGPPAIDLAPLLDRVSRNAETVRDALLEPFVEHETSWSCTVWPVKGSGGASGDTAHKLVIEVRDVAVVEGAKARQRTVAERLLLGALRNDDTARDAVSARARAEYLAKTSRDLSMSLDESATRDTVRRLTLPRPGSWCIVDVIESNGAIRRLAVSHPDPGKRALALVLEELWPSRVRETLEPEDAPFAADATVVPHEAGAALMRAARGEENVRILNEIGFGSLLIVPLIVRARIQGAITFVSGEGDAPFTSDDKALAMDVAARCAMALDNARLYREADVLRLAAERANRSKTDFLGGMSHELRTPLNAIGGYAELMDMEVHGPVTEKQHVALARIKANQEHLLVLITEILNFARVESGRVEYQNAEISVTDALADVAEMLSGSATDRGLILDAPRCDGGSVAWADPDRVRQILVNLLMNAVKYTPPNGGTITLTCSIAGDTVLAQIADSGAGIPPAKLESVFEPFVQLTSGLADRRGGVGLGLAISRDLARAMRGDLTVESTVGVGSRFTLTLPRARSGLPATESGAP